MAALVTFCYFIFIFREAAELEAEVKKRLRYVVLGTYAVIVL
jgi:hypothetical protein